LDLDDANPIAVKYDVKPQLLLAKVRVAVIWLVVIPVAWCFVTGANLWVLEAPTEPLHRSQGMPS
jgi:hypothetical protein